MNVGRACRILCAALAASLSTLSGLRVALAQQPTQATQPPAGSIPQANRGARADVLAAKDQSKTASALLALDQFKQFISSPPIIKNLVFQQKVPMGGGMRPLDGTFAFSTSFEYFQAKWQTNGLFFRRISRPADANSLAVAGQLVSWSGHDHALVEARPLLTTWDDRDPSVAGQTIGPFYTSHFFLDPLRAILNLGIMYAEIGAVRWEGNRFRTECEVDHIYFNSSNTKAVIATSDWNQGLQNGAKGYLVSVVELAGTNPQYSYNTAGYQPTYCYGSAKFTDPAGNTDSLPYWENGIADYYTGVPTQPASGGYWGVPSGGTCP